MLFGIRKLHSLTRRADGSLIASRLSCLNCTLSTLCEPCSVAQPIVVSRVEEAQEIIEQVPLAETDEEGGESDTTDDDGSLTENEITAGDAVWAKFVRWIPAKVLSLSDVPVFIQAKLPQSKNISSLFVKRFTDQDIRRVPVSKLEELGENKIDRFRAAKSISISSAYNRALAYKAGEPVV